MAKKYIQVAGNSQYTRPQRPNQLITHPPSNTTCFGRFPGFNLQWVIFLPGPIHMKRGRHHGEHDGFGVEHIRIEHFSHIPNDDDARAEAIQFVCEILQPGAEIYYEGGTGRHSERSMVCRNEYGVVILEAGKDGNNNTVYFVVTAYPRLRPHGTRVARL
jgi:hypothetical protein